MPLASARLPGERGGHRKPPSSDLKTEVGRFPHGPPLTLPHRDCPAACGAHAAEPAHARRAGARPGRRVAAVCHAVVYETRGSCSSPKSLLREGSDRSWRPARRRRRSAASLCRPRPGPFSCWAQGVRGRRFGLCLRQLRSVVASALSGRGTWPSWLAHAAAQMLSGRRGQWPRIVQCRWGAFPPLSSVLLGRLASGLWAQSPASQCWGAAAQVPCAGCKALGGISLNPCKPESTLAQCPAPQHPLQHGTGSTHRGLRTKHLCPQPWQRSACTGHPSDLGVHQKDWLLGGACGLCSFVELRGA